MKRSSTQPSTTATPHRHKFTLSPRGLVAILASSTVVTLPTAAALLHRHSPGLALLAGLLPLVPLVLLSVAFVSGYMAVSMLATLVTVVRLARGHHDPDSCLDDLFMRITNAPISFLTLTPLKFPARAAGRTGSPSPLPPGAPGSARDQDTKIYWDVLQHMMAARPAGVPDIIKSRAAARPGEAADDPTTQPIPGRHEKSETEPRSESRNRAAALSS